MYKEGLGQKQLKPHLVKLGNAAVNYFIFISSWVRLTSPEFEVAFGHLILSIWDQLNIILWVSLFAPLIGHFRRYG